MEEVYEQVDKVARALRAIGFGQGDEIPVFLRSVPEFIFLLLGAEKIGASLLCRDNTLDENIEAVKKSNAKMIIAHDFLSHDELNAFRKRAGIRGAVLLSPLRWQSQHNSGLLLGLSGWPLHRSSCLWSMHIIMGSVLGIRRDVHWYH